MLQKIKKFFQENYKFLILILVIFSVFHIELPYKIYTPGGMVNLENRIETENGYSSEGEIGMAYVSMVKGSIPFLLLSYILPDWDIIPVSELTGGMESFEEAFEKDKLATKQSIDSAIISAFRAANMNIVIKKEIVHVTYIDEQAETDLQDFDIIEKIDGKEVSSTAELKEIVTSHQIGDIVNIDVLRDGKPKQCQAKIYEQDGPKIGIAMTITYDYEESPNVELKMKESEAGPSGGLMMSLAIYNTLTEKDITNGKKIIGTGTIDIDGNVGPIGGVRYKLIGAVKKKADIFLVPEENYEEAVSVKNEKGYDIRLISVKTLEEAISELAKNV